MIDIDDLIDFNGHAGIDTAYVLVDSVQPVSVWTASEACWKVKLLYYLL